MQYSPICAVLLTEFVFDYSLFFYGCVLLTSIFKVTKVLTGPMNMRQIIAKPLFHKENKIRVKKYKLINEKP